MKHLNIGCAYEEFCEKLFLKLNEEVGDQSVNLIWKEWSKEGDDIPTKDVHRLIYHIGEELGAQGRKYP